MGFWRVVAVLNARKWLIIFAGLAATMAAWAGTRLLGSRYLASVDFIAPTQTIIGTPVGANTGSDADTDSRDLSVMYAEIIKSQAVIEPVLTSMDQRQLTGDLLNNIDVVSTSPQMYQLQVTDKNAGRATQLANALGEQFIKVYHDINTQQATKAVDVLTQQLHTSDVALEEARRRYDVYQAKHNIVDNLNGSVDLAVTEWRADMQKRDAAQVDLSDMSARLRSLEVLRAQIPALSQPEAVAQSPLAQQQQDLTRADDDLMQLRAKYTDAMPKVKAAIAARNALAERLQKEWAADGAGLTNRENASLQSVNAEIGALQQNVAGASAQVTQLNNQVAQAKAVLDSYKGVDMPLTMLAGDIAEKSDQRNGIAQRLVAARQALDVAERQNPLTMMDHVNQFNPPTDLTQGRTKKMLLLAALATMVCVGTLVVALDSVDKRVKTVRQAEQALPCGILAVIPQPDEALLAPSMARITQTRPHSMCSEAYRFLGFHILSAPMASVRSIMCLAAKPDQGSTSTLCNLAVTLAQAGRRVVIVDANIREPQIHRVFDGANQIGFTDLVQHPTQDLLNSVLKPTGIDGLMFIPSGPTPENPWQLFRSDALEEISRLLRDAADYVLYDTPSSLLYTDALNLAPIMDAAILCVRAFEPLTGAEQRLVNLLESQGVPVLGCVLSDIPAKVLESYSNYEASAEIDRQIRIPVAHRQPAIGAPPGAEPLNKPPDGYGRPVLTPAAGFQPDAPGLTAAPTGKTSIYSSNGHGTED